MMLTMDEDKTTDRMKYVRLSQLYEAMCSLRRVEYSSVIEGILQRGGDVNYAVPAGSLVKLHNPDWLGYTPLHFAAIGCYENEFGVKGLLDAGADFTVKSQDGSTALRLAIEHSQNKNRSCLNLKGQLEHSIADRILSAHVRTAVYTNPSCKDGISHLHIACMFNNEEAVELFLKGGASVNEAVDMYSSVVPGYTPLHFVARYCSEKAASVLLKFNADMNLKDASGMTPLHLLIERNRQIVDTINLGMKKTYARFREELDINENIIYCLLEKHKADNPDCIIIDDIGLSHFHVACTKKMSEYADRIILKCNVDINAPINFDSGIWPGYTPLHFAAHFNIDVVRLLLKNGANIAAKDAKGLTPLDLCMERYEPNDIYSILLIQDLKNILMSDNTKLLDMVDTMRDWVLVEHHIGHEGIQRQVTLNSPIWAGYTPLHLSVAFAKKIENSDVLYENTDYLCEKKPENQGKCSLQTKRSMSTILACIQCGANITVQCANGMSPLHLAFRQQKKHIVNLLIENIHIVENATDYENLSHLHILCAEGYKEKIEIILRCNININSSVKSGFKWYNSEDTTKATFVSAGSTALHISVVFGYVEIAKLLLKHGADPLARDDDELTPLHLAFLTPLIVGKADIFNALLAAPGTDSVNITTSEGLSHFHVACFANNRSVVEKLLRLEVVDVNAPITCQLSDTHADHPEAIKADDDYTNDGDVSINFLSVAPYAGYGPLHMAVEGHALETLDLLLRSGADARAKDAIGLTPLQFALSIYTSSYEKVNRDIIHRLTAAIDTLAPKCVYEANNGLTSLHVACATLDRVAAERALASGADVDARLDLDSPIWPGCTPLHVLVSRFAQYTDAEMHVQIEGVAELLLLGHQADVNLINAENLTPTHFLNEWHGAGKGTGPILDLIFRSPRIFETNPVDNNGLSHFHVACMRNDPRVVEEYLRRGLANVHRPKDYFVDYQAGYTPLHFAMAHSCSTAVIETLLRHGANVAAEDSYGDTSLHVAEKIQNVGGPDNAETILSIGRADINARNIFGKTPLEMSFTFGSKEMVEVLLRHGARVNVVNPVSLEGLLAIALCYKYTKDGDNVVFKMIMENAVGLTDVDSDTGFNAIHNIVSISCLHCSRRYIDQIGQLLEKGCDLEHQDNKGRTPLHIAVKFNSKSAVTALLNLGADINIADADEMVPLDYSVKRDKPRTTERPTDPYTDNILFVHVIKLSFAKLHVNEGNLSHYSTMKIRNTSYEMTYSLELAEMEEVEVDVGYSLRDFLTEAALTAYPGMTQQRRQAIGQLVGSSELLTKFPQLGCLLRLQYRKALARLKLMEPAKDALEILAGFGLPDPCTETIIRFLRNENLKNLIALCTWH